MLRPQVSLPSLQPGLLAFVFIATQDSEQPDMRINTSSTEGHCKLTSNSIFCREPGVKRSRVARAVNALLAAAMAAGS